MQFTEVGVEPSFCCHSEVAAATEESLFSWRPIKESFLGKTRLGMTTPGLLVLGAIILISGSALAQTPDYKNVGRTPTKQEIEAVDISVGPDGKGLPAGTGNAKDGAVIFAEKCAICQETTGPLQR